MLSDLDHRYLQYEHSHTLIFIPSLTSTLFTLQVISSPSEVSSQYIRQRDDNELHSCDLALRKITVLLILGSERSPTLRLQHYQRGSSVE